jgi:Uma2 family endonuclease
MDTVVTDTIAPTAPVWQGLTAEEFTVWSLEQPEGEHYELYDDMVVCVPMANRASLMLDPVIAVEMMSPSSFSTDLNRKREGYMRVPSLQHYLVIDAEARQIFHFRREADGSFDSDTLGDGPLTLDPPGITIDRLFP